MGKITYNKLQHTFSHSNAQFYNDKIYIKFSLIKRQNIIAAAAPNAIQLEEVKILTATD